MLEVFKLVCDFWGCLLDVGVILFVIILIGGGFIVFIFVFVIGIVLDCLVLVFCIWIFVCLGGLFDFVILVGLLVFEMYWNIVFWLVFMGFSLIIYFRLFIFGYMVFRRSFMVWFCLSFILGRFVKEKIIF